MSIRKGTKVIAEVADSSTFAKNSEVVKLSGNQEINGSKSFTSTLRFGKDGVGVNWAIRHNSNNQHSTASSSETQASYPMVGYDLDGNQFWQFKTATNTENQIFFLLKSKDNNWRTPLSLRSTNNSAYAVAPTVGVTTNNDTIATTKFVRDLLGKVFSKNSPVEHVLAGGTGVEYPSGNITLSESFLNYDFLLIWGTNDSHYGSTVRLIPTWLLDWVLSRHKNTVNQNVELISSSWFYWGILSYQGGSTNTLFKSSGNENGIILGIVGIRIAGN